MSKTLYHPWFEPNEAWLRGMLLFYDTVNSIVPRGAAYKPSPGIDRLMEKLPEAFVPIEPTIEDLAMGEGEYPALNKVLEELAGEGGKREQIPYRIEQVGENRNIYLLEGVALHKEKLGELLIINCTNRGLAARGSDPNWIRMDGRVAGLVLSLLADRMVANRSDIDSTASDQELSFFAAVARHAMGPGERRNDAALASAIVTAEIPDDIADLPLNQYVDIREKYAERREVFHLGMKELKNLYLERSLRDPTEFQRELGAVIKRMNTVIEKQKAALFRDSSVKWGNMALGGIVEILGALIAIPAVNVSGVCVGLALQLIRERRTLNDTYIAKTGSLLVEINRDLRWSRSRLGRLFV